MRYSEEIRIIWMEEPNGNFSCAGTCLVSLADEIVDFFNSTYPGSIF